MKVAFVSGANKGIGLALVEKLARTFGSTGFWDVYLTARNEERGRTACSQLENLGLKVKFHLLDVVDPGSRKSFLQFMKSQYPDGINIAVNNAGINYKSNSNVPFGEQARVTVNTNFTETVNFTQEFLPLLAKDARVVHLGSILAASAYKKLGSQLKSKFASPISLEELRSLMDDFVRHAEAGDAKEYGWPEDGMKFNTSYCVSKLGIVKASMILGDSLKSDPRRIVMNVCCPGYVDTDMTDHKGTKTPAQGADTPFYLATLPVGVTDPVNQFVAERKVKKIF
ncbi:unnamed protein product [Calicophoron daubneyi]|uniref:Carbonyl reductase n=1 Tax=Calicophoron daubneyi TaxID=300641 RepID=A0AAV2TUM9_CALDB